MINAWIYNDWGNPWYLSLLLLLPFLLFGFFKLGFAKSAWLKFSVLPPGGNSWKGIVRRFLPLLKVAAIGLIIIGLARPRDAEENEKIFSEGIDIVLSLDISGSMLARDFKPDRLGASKKTASDFIQGREFDRIGLVLFAGEAFTQCPLTSDHDAITQLVDQVQAGVVEDGTAIGEGLTIAVNRLRESESESKVIVLLTDGVSNKGSIDPLTAAELAKEYDIKVYTIGVGSNGKVPYPQKTFGGRTIISNVEMNLDEDLLKAIAKETNGKYFKARSNKALENIYSEIDRLEKTEIEVTAFKKYTERFYKWIIWALALLLIHFILRTLVLRGITE